MTKTLHRMPAALLIVAMAGCSSSDERLARIAMESTERQAEQNREMSQLNREVAEGTKRISEAITESRQEILAMEADLQVQRTRLEEERRSLANERYRESLLAPILDNLGVLLVVCLPLVICCLLLFNLRKQSDDDAAVCDLLIEEITANQPQLLAPLETRRTIEHEASLSEHE
jgi:uncharacterized protein involved in type VI secretion and phage assembly